MRLNKYIALATGMSRRKADDVITQGAVQVNGKPAAQGVDIADSDIVSLHGKVITPPSAFTTLVLHKPVGYVCSRDGQGSATIYDLLPKHYHSLKPIGRLDKDSSGLLLLTNDGTLAHKLTHPSNQKIKIYQVTLNKPLSKLDWSFIHEQGINLEDGPSKLFLERLEPLDDTHWQVSMHEGRNRQIRRTFEALGYNVKKLHRVQFGDYKLGTLKQGAYTVSQ